MSSSGVIAMLGQTEAFTSHTSMSELLLGCVHFMSQYLPPQPRSGVRHDGLFLDDL